jgi:hypothetical protein
MDVGSSFHDSVGHGMEATPAFIIQLKMHWS